jgi:membrane-associated protease RseP (regulator of RpoE activity)
LTDLRPPWEGERLSHRAPFGYRPVLLEARERPEPVRQRWGLAAALLALTFVTTTTMGAVWMLYTSTRVLTELPLFMLPETVVEVWSDPELLGLGLSFSVPSLLILLCHELGHYLACRRYRLPSTLPYFLPFPLGIGTLGAFIRIRAVVRTKRELFDVGVAGPLAGFAVLVPVLVAGVAWSEPVLLASLPPEVGGLLLVPGESLALSGLTALFHGPLGPDRVLQLHPFALAGWLGLLATSLNLIPLGQLDGGHILYAAVGGAQRRLALPLWLALLAVAVFLWPGWLLWCLVTLVMGLHHPPVRDEEQALDPARRLLAWVALAIFALSFMPVPIGEVLIYPGT